MREHIHTNKAPAAIGAYSQGIKVNNFIFLAGQIPLDPGTLNLVGGNIKQQIVRVFDNIHEIVKEAGGTLDQIVKLTVYLTDLSSSAVVNEVMGEYFKKPYPARTTVQVSALPKEAQVEIEAILAL